MNQIIIFKKKNFIEPCLIREHFIFEQRAFLFMKSLQMYFFAYTKKAAYKYIEKSTLVNKESEIQTHFHFLRESECFPVVKLSSSDQVGRNKYS